MPSRRVVLTRPTVTLRPLFYPKVVADGNLVRLLKPQIAYQHTLTNFTSTICPTLSNVSNLFQPCSNQIAGPMQDCSLSPPALLPILMGASPGRLRRCSVQNRVPPPDTAPSWLPSVLRFHVQFQKLTLITCLVYIAGGLLLVATSCCG
jgi:hypothetical protein